MAKEYEFDKVTKTELLGVRVNGNRVYTGKTNSGGFVMSIIMDSIMQDFSSRYQSDPIALNCFFLSKSLIGDVVVELEDIKISSKGYCLAQASLKQRADGSPLLDINDYRPSEWSERVKSIVTMGNMDGEEGITLYTKNHAPPSEDILVELEYPFMKGLVKTSLDVTAFAIEEHEGRPEVDTKMAFGDDRPIDFKSMPFWCDMSMTPPVLLGEKALGGSVWCPTMQLEVQFKRKPSGTAVLGHFLAPHIINNRFDIVGEVWDMDGNILAITTHQCLIVPWSRNSKLEMSSL
ncbi:thioesterase-like superfamily-domain-containing protein [Pilobolus umbonatus]|nr:thioesterase-like superfamily-domain-containing protein [Pilobolus umbonatus]